MKIGFIGLGIMGSRMAMNLIKNGFSLIVYNRSKEKAQPLLSAGAEWSDLPSKLAGRVDMLITMLSTPEAVEELATGENGFLNKLPGGSLWMDCTTVNPSFTQKMAKLADQNHIRFVDAPVAGSKKPAETGQLLFLVGGKREDVVFCEPLFKAMGKKFIHVGESGMGSALKMVFNLLLGEAMIAFAEALNLGENLGLKRSVLLDVLLESPVTAPYLSAKRMHFEQENFETEFPLRWMQKDLQLASQSAYQNDIALPALNVIKEVYALAKRQGFGTDDFSAIYAFLKKNNEKPE
ncbi:MAG: NAD(P)-dependent oxidoreductase [Calditrichaeota bacterium]|nr:NAD(P)-dependent oxidoreductase [Calditrichota bacterium]